MVENEAQEIISIIGENSRKIEALKRENAQLKAELIQFCVEKGYLHCLSLDLRKLDRFLR